MKYKIASAFIFILTFSFSINTYSQNTIGVGASVMANLQSNGIGGGLRAQFMLYRNLSIVPQAYYYPSFNAIHEYYLGANLHYEIYRWAKFTPYLTAGGFYNHWENWANFIYPKAGLDNIVAEGGIGILFGKKCWKPFIEQRYNPIWQEGTLRLGIMWYPLCGGSTKGINRRTYKCPPIQ